jgi:DNA mismatch repair protein MSH5
VLLQANPQVVLTSSKADDEFMNKLRDHSWYFLAALSNPPTNSILVDVTGGVFQIRPHKDFVPSKGHERLLSLNLLSSLPQPDWVTSTESDVNSNTSNPKNAYDFMRRQKDVSGDPTMRRWNALIRLYNFASIENAPLCVSPLGVLPTFPPLPIFSPTY